MGRIGSQKVADVRRGRQSRSGQALLLHLDPGRVLDRPRRGEVRCTIDLSVFRCPSGLGRVSPDAARASLPYSAPASASRRRRCRPNLGSLPVGVNRVIHQLLHEGTNRG